MNFLKRLWNMITNRAHTVLDRIESPDDKLKHFLNELQDKIGDLQASVTGSVVEEKKLMRNLEQQLGDAKKWEDRARLALRENKEDLAKQALTEQQQVLLLAEATKNTLEVQQKAVAELKKSLVSSKEKLGEARRQYQLAMARYKSAETKVKLAEVSSSSSEDSPLKLLEELDNKILLMESEAESRIELGYGDAHTGELESQFRLLEKNNDVEKRLETMKSAEPGLLSYSESGEELKKLLDKN